MCLPPASTAPLALAPEHDNNVRRPLTTACYRRMIAMLADLEECSRIARVAGHDALSNSIQPILASLSGTTKQLSLHTHVDHHTSRRSVHRDELVRYPRRSTSSLTTGLEEMDEQHTSDREVSWRIHDRQLFDADNKPSVGHDGPDEKDRLLVDEFHPKCVFPGYTV